MMKKKGKDFALFPPVFCNSLLPFLPPAGLLCCSCYGGSGACDGLWCAPVLNFVACEVLDEGSKLVAIVLLLTGGGTSSLCRASDAVLLSLWLIMADWRRSQEMLLCPILNGVVSDDWSPHGFDVNAAVLDVFPAQGQCFRFC
ncbi:hypothetical protein Nepgr_005385 [Nepenthes gracilis]|uniref:Uncharacterized protein n=1 Tax=Nepenthes gracilis TaxID=150966 RepID=A0AAD3S3F5_NEPGR|nr:hypothetical protein Nepgr_005385 [Nepenthes gracilis]